MMPPAPDWVALRRQLMLERGPLCERQGCRNGWQELHHAIVAVRRKPERLYRALSVPANLMCLCSECHMLHGRDRAMRLAFIDKQKVRGYDLRAFVDSLPLKDKADLYRLVA